MGCRAGLGTTRSRSRQPLWKLLVPYDVVDDIDSQTRKFIRLLIGTTGDRLSEDGVPSDAGLVNRPVRIPAQADRYSGFPDTVPPAGMLTWANVPRGTLEHRRSAFYRMKLTAKVAAGSTRSIKHHPARKRSSSSSFVCCNYVIESESPAKSGSWVAGFMIDFDYVPTRTVAFVAMTARIAAYPPDDSSVAARQNDTVASLRMYFILARACAISAFQARHRLRWCPQTELVRAIYYSGGARVLRVSGKDADIIDLVIPTHTSAESNLKIPEKVRSKSLSPTRNAAFCETSNDTFAHVVSAPYPLTVLLQSRPRSSRTRCNREHRQDNHRSQLVQEGHDERFFHKSLGL